MAFEGEHKVIPIKGIARAGADTVCEDGAMNEVIGLEYKDGSYVPYAGTQMNVSLPKDVASPTLLRTHKTNGGNNIISYFTNYQGIKGLFWLSEEQYNIGYGIDSNYWTLLYEGNVKDVEFIGNAIVVLTNDEIITLLYNADGYTRYNGRINDYPESLLQFRVSRGMAGHDFVEDFNGELKQPVSAHYINTEIYGGIDSNGSAIKNRWRELNDVPDNIELGSSLLTRAQGLVAEKGGLTGYFLVCFAYRMKDGSLKYASAPVLMSPPCIKQKGNFVSANLDSENTDKTVLYAQRENRYASGGGPDDNPPYVELSLSEGIFTETEYEKVGEKNEERGVFDGAYNFETEQFGVTSGVFREGKRVDFGYNKVVESEGLSSDATQYLLYRKVGFVKGMDYEDFVGNCKGSGVAGGNVRLYPRLFTTPPKVDGGNDYRASIFEEDAHPEIIANTMTVPLNSMITLWVMNGDNESWEIEADINTIYKSSSCCGLSNKLQFHIDKSYVNKIPKDVSSICIFISPEITPFKDITQASSVISHGPFYGGLIHYDSDVSANTFRITYTYTPQYRDAASIIKDINDITSMYLVDEIGIDELKSKNTDEWIDVDLRGLLGDTLVTRESLPSTAFNRVDNIANAITSYNYRLHIGNLKQKLFDGFNGYAMTNYYNNGRGQYNNTYREGGALKEALDSNTFHKYSGSGLKTTRLAFEVHIENEDGSDSVVVYDNLDITPIIGLQKMLTYPSPNANKMIVYHNDWYKEFVLHQNKYLGISYAVNDDLKLFGSIGTTSGWTNDANKNPSPINTTRVRNNVVKVSKTAHPSILPEQNTYNVGNGTVIGFARINTALSDDTYGRNPLLIFTTDGTYTMEVDTSGAGAYVTTPKLFSNEICVNPNSICEIIGGVVFASSRGLMVATSNGIAPLLQLLNGKPKHKPQYGSNIPCGSGMNFYGEMVTYSNLQDYISSNDFIDFVKDVDTHIVYIGIKNKLYIYNKGNVDRNVEASAYWVDIETGSTTKLTDVFEIDDNDPNDAQFAVGNKVYKLDYSYQGSRIPTLLQTRPIKISNSLKTSYRVVLRGYFHAGKGTDNNSIYSSLLVLGSIDGEHWQPIGVKEKEIIKVDASGQAYEQPFHDIGCVTDRESVKYLMVVFASYLDADSHIDGIELTIDNKYNNKLR